MWFWGRRGGGAQYTCALAEGLRGRDSIHLSASVSHRLESLDRLRESVPDPQIVALDGSFKSFPLLLPGPTSFGATLRRAKVDVVLHTMVNPLTPVAWPRWSGIPIATVIHDAVPHLGDTAGTIARASRFAQKHSDLMIAPSETVAEILKFRHKTSWIETIALPPHVSLPDLWDLNGDVLFLGRIARYKGLDLLCDAWSELDVPNVRLRVVGEPVGEETAVTRLRNLGAKVETQWVPDDQLIDVLRGVKLLVLPYLEASQSGVITLAHAAGIPLLVTDVGGLPRQAGVSAKVTSPDPSSFAKGLRSLLVDPHELSRLRANAIETRGQSAHFKRQIADQFVDVLRRLHRRHRG